MHFPSNIKTNKSPSLATIPVVKQQPFRNSDRKPPTIVKVKAKVLNEKLRKKHDVKSPVRPSSSSTTGMVDQPFGIHIDSPNSNVRIQGSKIEVKVKPGTKRDLSEVILKVPDPSKFLTSPPVDARNVKPPSRPPPPLTPDKVHKPCDHNKKDHIKVKEDNPPPPLRRRPERSAKKRAKDSISEITEAERPIEKEEFHERLRNPSSPTPSHHGKWNSPPPSRSYSRTDYYINQSPPLSLRSPPEKHRHNHGHHSPFHRAQSPDHRSRSPTPLHAVRHSPLSPPVRHPPLSPPVRHRHSRSPQPLPHGRHGHVHSPLYRDHEEHVQQQYHYNEPLSPRYRGGSGHDSPFFYSERSRSPYLYDYHRHENERERLYEELERRSPPIKHRRMTSPVRDRDLFQSLHGRGEFSTHLQNEALSSPPQSRGRQNLHSPQESHRFPYGRTDWESTRFRHHDHSPPIRSSPLDPQFQYQPLSRMPPKGEQTSSVISPKHLREGDRLQRTRDPLMHVHDKRNDPISHPKASSTASLVAKDLLSPTPKRSKVVEIERAVIEIPEKAKTPQSTSERKTPVARKKGLGLLEMKIQGLKNKIGKTGVSEKIKERMSSQNEEHNNKDAKSKSSRSLSDVISSLSGSKSSNKNVPLLLSPSASESNKKAAFSNPSSETRYPSDVVSPIFDEKNSGKSFKQKSMANKRSKSLADITKNLTKSVEKQIVIENSIILSKPKVLSNTVNSNKAKVCGSKLSGVISSLKKSKDVVAVTLSNPPKDTITSNDSKLLNILKSGIASKGYKALHKKEADVKTFCIGESKPLSDAPKQTSIVQRKDDTSLVCKENSSLLSSIEPCKVTSLLSSTTTLSDSCISPSNVLLSKQPSDKRPAARSAEILTKRPPTTPTTTKMTMMLSEVKNLPSLEDNNDPSITERFVSPAGSPVYSPPVASSPLTIVIAKQKQTRPSSTENTATSVITPTRTPTPIMSPLSQTLVVVHSPRSNDSKSINVFPSSPPKLVDEALPSAKLTRPTAIMPTSIFDGDDKEGGNNLST